MPAERSYFVKVFVFEVGQDIVNVDELSDVEVEYETQLFITESYLSDPSLWNAKPPFPIKVEAGKTTEIDITLIPEI